jgi:hypothetical protein
VHGTHTIIVTFTAETGAIKPCLQSRSHLAVLVVNVCPRLDQHGDHIDVTLRRCSSQHGYAPECALQFDGQHKKWAHCETKGKQYPLTSPPISKLKSSAVAPTMHFSSSALFPALAARQITIS